MGVPVPERAAAEGGGGSPVVQALWCCFWAGGLIAMLLVYGLLQERIMTVPYDGVVFEYSVFLVFVNRIAAALFAIAMATVRGEPLQNSAPLWKYLVASLANVFASTCQYEALKYVSFAVQMLGKSFKMMPVMVWGMVISRKGYGLKDWCVAAVVTVGVTEFLLTGPTTSPAGTGSSARGFALLLGFLAMDGLTSTMQERLFQEKTSKYNQMMYINGLSAAVSLATLACTGALRPAVSFFLAHGTFAADVGIISFAAVGAQFFIYSLVEEFGALVFAATMNVRQVVSIIVSYVTYGHRVTDLQVLGLGAVFATLLFKGCSGLLWEDERPEKRAGGAAAGLAGLQKGAAAGASYKATESFEGPADNGDKA